MPRSVAAYRRLRCVIPALLVVFSAGVVTLTLSGCAIDMSVEGESGRDREIARAVADYLLGIDGFDWPDSVRVDDKTVVLRYRDEISSDFAGELEAEVTDALHHAVNEEGWRLEVFDESHAATPLSFALPAIALWREVIPVGALSITVPFNWSGEWESSVRSGGPAPSYRLTIYEPWVDDDEAGYTSRIQVESYETTEAAYAARKALVTSGRKKGWSQDQPVSVRREGFTGSATRLTSQSGAFHMVSELILLPSEGGAIRIVRIDEDAADRGEAARSLDETADRLIKLLKVSSDSVE